MSADILKFRPKCRKIHVADTKSATPFQISKLG